MLINAMFIKRNMYVRMYISLGSYFNKNLLDILLCGSEELSVSVNKEILKSTIKFPKASKRFDVSLYGPLSIYK